MSYPYIRKTSDGLNIDVTNDDEFLVIETSVGNYHITSNELTFYSDDACDLGNAAKRYKDLYLASGAINSSDERMKSFISDIPDCVLDAWGEVKWCQYKMNNAVQKKGESTARFHIGLIAQRIKDIFASRGLDACEYGLICHETWDARPAMQDENGKIVEPAIEAGDIWMLRYSECLAVEAAYQRRRITQLEERINQLTNLNN